MRIEINPEHLALLPELFKVSQVELGDGAEHQAGGRQDAAHAQ